MSARGWESGPDNTSMKIAIGAIIILVSIIRRSSSFPVILPPRKQLVSVSNYSSRIAHFQTSIGGEYVPACTYCAKRCFTEGSMHSTMSERVNTSVLEAQGKRNFQSIVLFRKFQKQHF